MDDSQFGLIEIVLAFGALLGWAVWELVRTRRELARIKQQHGDSTGPSSD